MTEYYNHLSVLVNATKMKALLLLMLQTFVTVETNLFGVLEKVFGSDRKSKTDDDWLYPTFEGDDKIPPRTYNTTKFGNGTEIYRLLVVTDMDKFAKTATDWTWRAVTREGRLQLVKDHETLRNVTITWKRGSDRNLTTQLNMKGRAMELSDLLEFDGRLLSPDDKTGMIYEIRNGKAIPWLFLNSGPGNTTRGMKAEWTTIKGDYLYVGGHGTEYRNENGTILSEEAMWIKIINKHGEIKSVNWKDVYKRVRNAVNITEPGYLTHEAVQWSENQQKWFFLPRKESQTIYSEKDDEMKGSNLLIIGDPHLQHFQAVRIGKLTYPKRGFSAFFFVPGTQDRIIVALKSEEVEGSSPKSYVTVFDINGNILLDDKKLEDDYKFEGIYFI